MVLANETEVDFDLHEAWIDWDGELRRVLAVKAEGVPLIGMAMLRGYRLTVDGVDGGPVTIDQL